MQDTGHKYRVQQTVYIYIYISDNNRTFADIASMGKYAGNQWQSCEIVSNTKDNKDKGMPYNRATRAEYVKVIDKQNTQTNGT